MATITLMHKNPEDFGTPHVTKEFRRIIARTLRYSGIPSVTWDVEGITGVTTGIPSGEQTILGPNYFTFHLPTPRGRWIKRTFTLPGATDSGATLEEVKILTEKVRGDW